MCCALIFKICSVHLSNIPYLFKNFQDPKEEAELDTSIQDLALQKTSADAEVSILGTFRNQIGVHVIHPSL